MVHSEAEMGSEFAGYICPWNIRYYLTSNDLVCHMTCVKGDLWPTSDCLKPFPFQQKNILEAKTSVPKKCIRPECPQIILKLDTLGCPDGRTRTENYLVPD